MKPKYALTEFGKECSRFRDEHIISFKEMAKAAGVSEQCFLKARRSDRGLVDLRRKVREYMDRVNSEPKQ
ncbi:MAG: hypothetical protein LBI19_07335 [Oscillospiraceae bacterium]|jgi:hypothetical protein|nr:hypothetical protein [Oscillospiraceae bacterium]